MKLVGAEFSFDGKKLVLYFSADGRIDFRELVKDLASCFKTRIELRQIGIRDETKLLGCIAPCGIPCCCSTCMPDFSKVSIKMAKNQGLHLNPSKISGLCGRLMCCLKHEQDTYEYLNEKLPNVGDFVRTVDGNKGEVISVNVLRQKVKLLVTTEDDTMEIEEYKVEDIKFKPRKKKYKEKNSISDEELKELEELELKEGKSKFNDD